MIDLEMALPLIERYRIKQGNETDGLSKFFTHISQRFPRHTCYFADIKRATIDLAKTVWGQKRDDGDAEISHSITVAGIGMDHLRIHDPDYVIAWLLHDVVEDYPDEWSLKRIANSFGSRPAYLVGGVSKPQLKLFKGDRILRMQAFHEKLVGMGWHGAVMKSPDRWHNLITLPSIRDSAYRRQYVAETRAFHIPKLAVPHGILVEELKEACEHVLFEHDHKDE